MTVKRREVAPWVVEAEGRGLRREELLVCGGYGWLVERVVVVERAERRDGGMFEEQADVEVERREYERLKW